MEHDSFFNLIKNGVEDNLELAWQIAKGQKEAGDKFFTDFVQSVEFLSAFHRDEMQWNYFHQKKTAYSYPKVLSVIGEGRINLVNFNKNEFPEYFQALSELINRIYFESLASKVFPKGLFFLPNVNFVNVHLNNLIPIGNELFKMPKLDRLYISSSDSDIHISPEIIRCANLKELNLYTSPKNCIFFPEAFPQLNSLETLHIRAPFEGFKLEDLTVETLTLNLFDKKAPKGVETVERIMKTDRLSVHLKKLQLNFDSYNLRFETFLNTKIPEAVNLKDLTINNNAHIHLFESFLELRQLEKLTLYCNHYPLENAEVIAELPNLKEFTVSFHCSLANAEAMRAIFRQKGSKANLIVEELPF